MILVGCILEIGHSRVRLISQTNVLLIDKKNQSKIICLKAHLCSMLDSDTDIVLVIHEEETLEIPAI